MPNDTLDEIERQWKRAPGGLLHPWYGDCDAFAPHGQCPECLNVSRLAYTHIRTLIEMVRARDRELRQIADATAINVALSNKLVAALDTPPPQEPTE